MLFGLAGIVTFRTAEFSSALGSWMQPVERKEESPMEKSARTFLPTWVVHATVMVCFLGAFLTPVYSLVDCVRQAPLRQLAYTATAQQVSFCPITLIAVRAVIPSGNATLIFCTVILAALAVVRPYAHLNRLS